MYAVLLPWWGTSSVSTFTAMEGLSSCLRPCDQLLNVKGKIVELHLIYYLNALYGIKYDKGTLCLLVDKWRR